MYKYVSGVEIIAGLVLVIMGYVYITTPANLLPLFFFFFYQTPGIMHYGYGMAALVLGIVAFVMAAFHNPKRADN